MKKFGLGARLATGFVALLALMVVLGGISAWNMRAASDNATQLTSKLIPQLDLATEAISAMEIQRIAARTYGFTADPADGKKLSEAIADGLKALEELQAFARAHLDLKGLHDALPEVEQSYKAFTEYCQQTLQVGDKLATSFDTMIAAAAKFMDNLQLFSRHQTESLVAEIAKDAGAEALSERATKIGQVFDIEDDVTKIRVGIWKARALGDASHARENLPSFDRIATTLEQLAALVHTDQMKNTIAQFRADLDHYRKAYGDTIEAIDALSKINHDRIAAGVRALKSFEDVCTLAKGHMHTGGEHTQSILATATRVTLGGLVGAIAVGIALAFFITRGITRPVNRIIQSLTDGANQVTDASRQVASASQQLAAGASQQASSLEETSSALEQMAAMTRTNAANAEKANELASQARKNADQGEQTMGELNTAMSAINESAAQIGKIIKVIEEIAFQTNLLALNAAVEAARAGEMGKGFAVVAEEVRNLAQRSAQAARDTTNLIEGAVTRAKQGTTVATNAGKSLSSIVADVANVAELLAGISKASGEQAQGVDQINTAVSQMDKVTQQNAAGAEESASAAEQLSAQAQTLKQVVDELTVLVRGATGDASASAASSQGSRPRANRSAASAARSAPARAAAHAQPAHTPAAHDDFSFGQDFAAAGSSDADANLKQF